MDFEEILEKRRSIRSYSGRQVEKEKIDKIIEACISAPSAGNLQAYKIIIVRDEIVKKKISNAAFGQESASQAPVLLVFAADQKQSAKYGQRGRELYSIQDATIAAAYAQLEAVNLGLATVWIGAFDENEISKILGMATWQKPVAIIPVGYATEKGYPRKRRSRNEVTSEM
jgi:nitroreductase